jgi:hypothetical protein
MLVDSHSPGFTFSGWNLAPCSDSVPFFFCAGEETLTPMRNTMLSNAKFRIAD